MFEYEVSDFLKGLEELNVICNENQMKQFIKFYELLIEWNKVMNLTGITEFEEVVEKHFIDSLSIVRIQNLNQIESVLDIGTGAGFPGIPLKIIYPNVRFVLLDSLKKRVNFLNEVIKELGLEYIEVIHGRAEDFARKEEYREQFDLCVSRAVANLSTLTEYCLPYVKRNGFFISYKSGKIEEELQESKNAVFLLGGKLESRDTFMLPNSEISRTLIKIKKCENTSKKYPRKSGLPAKEPLK